jgi:NADPH-dependent 2,4-dienoyl-CoA reductase/sulfur reductase-like enzyme
MIPGARLVVVGGGFLGAEVASTAVALGLRVTMIEALGTPFERTLGPAVGRLLAERYRDHGVDLRLAAGVVGFRAGSDGEVAVARLGDGTEVRCDVALVGIGVEPARELQPRPVAGVPVYACGDVTGRLGHWTNAAWEGTAVARRILGLPDQPSQPFFWSDQFGLRLQLVGRAGATRVELDGGPDSYVARYRDEQGGLVGALAANRAGEIASLRRELAASAPDAVDRPERATEFSARAPSGATGPARRAPRTGLGLPAGPAAAGAR